MEKGPQLKHEFAQVELQLDELTLLRIAKHNDGYYILITRIN